MKINFVAVDGFTGYLTPEDVTGFLRLRRTAYRWGSASRVPFG